MVHMETYCRWFDGCIVLMYVNMILFPTVYITRKEERWDMEDMEGKNQFTMGISQVYKRENLFSWFLVETYCLYAVTNGFWREGE